MVAGALGTALVGGVVVGATVGSAGGPHDHWACPLEQIGTSVATLAEGGGYATEDEALRALPPYLAADGQRTEAEFAGAIASRIGPDRYDPGTGRIYVEDRVEVEIALTQLDDGTLTLGRMTFCGRPVPPELASPYPTPFPEDAAVSASPSCGSVDLPIVESEEFTPVESRLSRISCRRSGSEPSRSRSATTWRLLCGPTRRSMESGPTTSSGQMVPTTTVSSPNEAPSTS